MRLVALTGGRYHAASLSCARTRWKSCGAARDAGLAVSASASINHLTLNENDIGPYRTFLKLSPPLRTEDDRKALVEAIASGLIDVIMSDHNPQDVEVKRLPFAEAASGAIGLETMLPAALRLIHNGEVDFKTLIRAMSTRPAELLGLPGGSLRAGAPADVIVIDQTRPGCSTRPISSRNARTRLSTRRGSRAGWCAPLSAAAPYLNMSERWQPGSMGANAMTADAFLLAAFLLGYLLGSIPFGLVLTRLAGTADLRTSAPAISARPTCCAPGARASPRRHCCATCSRARSPC